MISHVSARGNNAQAIYVVDADRLDFLEVLHKVTEEANWRLLAYCLMGNHYHLVVEVPDGDLTAGMHRLNSTCSKRFNKRHAKKGHLFEKRYWADDLKGEDRLVATVGYVGRNPVRAGFCRRAGDWAWSSAGAAMGQRVAPPYLDVRRLWELMGPTAEAAQARLRQMYDDEARTAAEHLRDAVRERVVQAHAEEGLSVHDVARALQLSTSSVLELLR